MSSLRSSHRRQSGSAYIIALLVLVILTFMGMALAFTTQAEVQIGANERLANRVFYSAESGTAVALAFALVSSDYRGRVLRMADFVGASIATDDPDYPRSELAAATRTGFLVGTEISVSPFEPILSGPCNLCQINQGDKYLRVNHQVTSTAIRRGAVASSDDPIAGPPAGEVDPNPDRTTACSAVSVQVAVQPMDEGVQTDAGVSAMESSGKLPTPSSPPSTPPSP
jgi:hypothetical protein